MVCFIILHYMVSEETKKCVDSILKISKNKKIIVVDNNSPNDSFNILLDYYHDNEDVYVIKNKENAGYSKGCNFGYSFAKKNFANLDFIIIMNNDMEIKQKDFISKIYNAYEEDKFYVLGPDIYSTSNKIHQNPEPRSIRTIEKINSELSHMNSISTNKLRIKALLKKIPFLEKFIKFLKRKKRLKNKNFLSKQYNKTLHGSCLIFSKRFIDIREKAFFDKTKFYCEAQILDYECEKNNWLRLYEPSIKVLHHEDIATNATYSSYVKKSQFMNDCMINSLTEFKKLMESMEK